MYENPNLIPRILRQESFLIPIFRSHSCPVVFEYLEDLEFDEHFDLSFFETKYESVVCSTILNPEFVKDLEIERANRSIYDYILTIQTSIVATNIPEFFESASATLGSSVVVYSSKMPTETPFIPTIAMQPTISDQRPLVSSPQSTPSTPQKSHISSPPSTPHTPITSSSIVVPTPPTSPRPVSNPP